MSVSRRASLMVGLAGLGLGRPARAAAPPAGDAWQFKMTSIDEDVLDFGAYRGRVLLVVNTASFCGFTYQYKALEALHRDLGPRGLVVIGIPSQDFNQEKGSNGEVKAFCELTYGVQFPMAGLSRVTGRDAVPFYQWVRVQTGWSPRWNFFKVLVGRDGRIIGTYGSDDEPDRGRLRQAIEKALAQSAPVG